jgi:hypothetical protein
MSNYPKLILDLEATIGSLRGELLLEREQSRLAESLLEQRNRTIGELGASLAAVTAERDELKTRLTAMAYRWKTMIGRTPTDYAAGMQTAYDTAADLLVQALASSTQGEAK